MRSAVIAVSFTLAGIAGACGNNSQPSSRELHAQQEAKTLFDTKCTVCHNGNGDGNGPSSDGFDPKPHNYTDPAWQASVTDDQIKEIILKGGTRLGKNPAMPSTPRLREHPEVLDALVKLIRGFGKHP